MRRFFLLLAAVLIIGAAPLAAADGFVVDALDMSIEVMEDGSFAVTESLDLNFYEARRGIYRDIPVGYGSRRASVTDITASVPLQVERDRNYVSIRLGDADTTLTGAQNFVLRYVYAPYASQGDGEDQYDEFYYNLIGEGWTTDIQTFSATIDFPEPVNASRIWFTRGYWGSTSSDGISWELSDDGKRISVQASGFSPDEALTARVELPEGYFDLSSISDAGAVALVIYMGAVIVAVGIAFLVWSRWGRDDEPIVVVRFDPPDGMSPMDVGYCADGTLDTKDITSMLFSWADRGYLTIEEKSKKKNDTVFTRVKDLEGVPAHEKLLFDSFFACGVGGVVTVKNLEGKFGLSIAAIRSSQSGYFKGERALKNVTSSVASGLALFLAAVPILGFCYVGSGLFFDGMSVILGFIGFLCALTCGGIISSLLRTWHMKSPGRRIIQIIVGCVLAVIFWLGATVMSLLFSNQAAYISVISSTVMVLGVVSIMFLAVVTQKRSQFGQKVLEQILGYREFIEKVEVDKLKLLIDDDPEIFYHVLSYAIVLGLEDTWARKFASITVEPPSWYSSPTPVTDVLFYAMLTSRINTRMASTVVATSANKSPSMPGSRFGGSSFGGGGFSGGGFGGGGGRSW